MPDRDDFGFLLLFRQIYKKEIILIYFDKSNQR